MYLGLLEILLEISNCHNPALQFSVEISIALYVTYPCILFSFSVFTLQAKRDGYCHSQFSSAYTALFDQKFNQVGKVWRCFNDVALTQDPHSMLPVYDTVKNSPSLSSRTSDLLAITE